MPVFSDNFNRADGPVGDDWTVLSGTWAIASNRLVCTSAGRIRCNHLNVTDGLDISITQYLHNNPTPQVYFFFASDETAANCYEYLDGIVGGNPQGRLYKYIGGSYTGMGVQAIADPFLGAVTVRLLYTGGHVQVYHNGFLLYDVADSAVARGPYFILECLNGTTEFDDYSATAQIVRTLTIAPDPVWVGGGLVAMTATGTDTEWTPGTPGDTTITVDHGTIVGQVVESATLVNFWLDPAEYVGTLTFDESKYGLSDTVNATLDPAAGGEVGACLLSIAGAALINDSAVHNTGHLAREQSIVAAGLPGSYDLTLLTAIADLWYAEFRTASNPPSGWTDPSIALRLWTILNGQNPEPVGEFPAPRSTPIAHLIGEIIDSVDTLTSTDSIDLQDVLDAIAAIPGADVTTLRHEIGIMDQGTWTSILQVLLGLWGAGADTIESVGDQLRSVQTLSNWTLGNVKDWIEAIPAADLSAVLHKLDHIQPSEAVTLSTLDTDLAVVDLTADQIQVSLGAYRTGSNYTVQDILDAITAVGAKVDALAANGAPVWPGLGSVTLGPVLALADGMTIDGPLHGLIFTLTGLPARPIGYRFGDVTSWSRVGQASFASDRGDYERSQTIAFEQQVMACEKMAIADHARLYVNAGWTGTVRSWTLAP